MTNIKKLVTKYSLLEVSTTILDRLWANTLFIGECWVWQGSKAGGYGRIYVGKTTTRRNYCMYAHVVSYELLVGNKPKNMDLDHLCRNRACFNPSHLEPVTRSENVKRGIEAIGLYGALTINSAKTHCPSGHEYTEYNTRIKSDGGGRKSRSCIACQYKRDKGRIRDYRAKKKVL